MTIRALFISDTHCGSRYGLSPPRWQGNLGDHAYEGRRELWKWFSEEIAAIKAERPIDRLICVGDLIDGPGAKDGGSEQVTCDCLEQVDCACEVLETIGAEKVLVVQGTAYHTGAFCDYERIISQRFGAEFERTTLKDIGDCGCIFDIAHHTSGGRLPYGMNGAARDKSENNHKVARGDEEFAHVVIRGHVHWYKYMGQEDWLAMILPCLALPGSRYGARCGNREFTTGLVTFDIEQGGSYTWKAHIAKLQAARRQVSKF